VVDFGTGGGPGILPQEGESLCQVDKVAPEASAPRKSSDMPTDFLGVFDVTTSSGALGASITVALAFGVLVEGVKFIDRAHLP